MSAESAGTMTWRDDGGLRPLSASIGSVAGLLAFGSAFLLVAGLLGFPRWVTYTELFRNALLVLFGMILHFFGWLALYLRTWRDSRHGSPIGQRWPTPHTAFLLSVFAFVVSASVTPCIVSGWCASLSPLSLLVSPISLFVPYLPAVFAPVVLGHVYIFRAYARQEISPRRRRVAGIGLAWLSTVSIIGILGQLAYQAGAYQEAVGILGSDAAAVRFGLIFLPFPAGLTAIGYGIEFAAWRWNVSPIVAGASS